MISDKERIRFSKAFAEVLHYLKGVRKEDTDRIPKKIIELFEENADKNYVCDFDYRKPLNELDLLIETKGLLGMLCLNYLCDSEEQRQALLERFAENERLYKRKKYEKLSKEEAGQPE